MRKVWVWLIGATCFCLSLNAGTEARLLISDGEVYQFGSQVVKTQTSKEFKVINTGTIAIKNITHFPLMGAFSYSGGKFPGVGGTCGNELGAKATCKIVVSFQPNETGVFKTSLYLNYEVDGARLLANRYLEGEGITSAQLLVSEEGKFDFGKVVLGRQDTKTFTLKNQGNASVTQIGSHLFSELGSTPAFSFLGGNFPGRGGDCRSELKGGQSCRVVVSFLPVQTGRVSAPLGLGYFDGEKRQTVSLTVAGEGVPPARLSVSGLEAPPETIPGKPAGPSVGYLGKQLVGLKIEKSFTLVNSGGLSATKIRVSDPQSPFKFKGGDFPGAGGNCGVTLDSPQGNCQFLVEFSPENVSQAQSPVNLTYFDGVRDQKLSFVLVGDGLPPGKLEIEKNLADFGSELVGVLKEHVLVLKNAGSSPVTQISDQSFLFKESYDYKAGKFPGEGGNCGETLQPGDSCKLSVLFSPKQAGLLKNQIQIDYQNGVGLKKFEFPISGKGLQPARLSVSNEPQADFGTRVVGENIETNLTLLNTGDIQASQFVVGPLSSGFEFFGGKYPGKGGTCDLNPLLPGKSCTLKILWAPTVAGAAQSSFQLSYFNGLENKTVDRLLVGKALNPARLVASGIKEEGFGNVPVGGGKELQLILKNEGDAPADGIQYLSLSGPYGLAKPPATATNACGRRLNGNGAECFLAIRFQPTVAGQFPSSLNIHYRNGVSEQRVVLSIFLQGQATQVDYVLDHHSAISRVPASNATP